LVAIASLSLGDELFELVAMNGVAFVDAPNVGKHALGTP